MHRGKDRDPLYSISPAVLELNPQLRSLLSFVIGSDSNVLRSMESLQHLEDLNLVWDMKYATRSNELNVEVFRFQNVKSFRILFFNATRRVSLPKIPFVLDRLEKCSLQARATDLEELYEFLIRNPTIVDLELQLNCLSVNLTRIGQASPSLRHFKFSCQQKLFFKKECVVEFANLLPF